MAPVTDQGRTIYLGSGHRWTKTSKTMVTGMVRIGWKCLLCEKTVSTFHAPGSNFVYSHPLWTFLKCPNRRRWWRWW